jgi:cell division protein FtsN
VKFASAITLVVLLSACDPTTRRPTFLPRPEAATTELELAVPAATRALAEALEADSVPLARIVARDGFVESPWLDAATMKPATRQPVGPSVVRLRGWVDPSRYGYSRLTVEVIYRAVVDPSLPVRETEAAVPYANPARARVRTILGKLGGTPVDQPEVVVARAPAEKPGAAGKPGVAGKADSAGTPVPSPIPSPVSVDSGALLRGKRDSITSAAPTAAPTQGQRAAPPPAPTTAARDTGRPRVRTDTTRPQARTDTVRQAPAAPAARPAAPVVRTPAPVATPAPARRAARYSVQVAAARRRAEVDPIVASLIASGFPARIVTSGGWEKVWVGDYSRAGAADSVRRVIRARQGGSPFVVRQP